MLTPNSSALGPPGAKRGGGSSLATDVSCFGVAGDAQATTHTSSTSVHIRGRATLLSAERPPASWLVADLRARRLAIACRRRCVACHSVRSHAVPVALIGECSTPVVSNVARQPRSSY